MMITIREEVAADAAVRCRLVEDAFGADYGPKPSDRVRLGRRPAAGLALIAEATRTAGMPRPVGSVRLWHVAAGEVPALLLGPLAVAPAAQGQGIGAILMRRALNRAGVAGHRAVLLVGDAAYYGRFGFSAATTQRLTLGPDCEPARFLGLELVPGALSHARGPVIGTGAADAVVTPGWHPPMEELPLAA